jgi:glyoxylase-like metal-dependent hydrolase (beta-lactamase superfamily II)
MLNQVAEGVFVHESEFIKSNSIVVPGTHGVLLIDPGITGTEMAHLAVDLREVGQTVVAGFSTHPDWDHVLWHESFGDVPRYGTARNAASMRDLRAKDDWRQLAVEMLPPEYVDDIPLDLLGVITGLSPGATTIPWDGPSIRILEHQGHATGHAALLIEERRVLIAGDMLSDVLVPFLDFDASDPIGDYLAGLQLLESVAKEVGTVVPGHGSVGTAADVLARIQLDRLYLRDLDAGVATADYRVGPSAPIEWLADVHNWHLQRLAEKRETAGG